MIRVLANSAVVSLITLGLLTATPAQGQVRVRVATLKAADALPMWHASNAGYFREVGLDVQIMILNNGPAVVSAIVSKSADVGFAAAVAVLNARANNQSVKLFSPLGIETADGVGDGSWLDAPERGGDIKIADLKGKTIALNAAGGQCELMLRTHLMSAGLAWSDVEILILPFPQMLAALQLGSAYAACTIEPFHTMTRLSQDIKSRSVISGTSPDLKVGLVDGFFAADDWLKSNPLIAEKFAKSIVRANRDMMKDPTITAKLMETVLGLSPEIAAAAKLSLNTASGPVSESDFQTLIEMMTKVGMLTKTVGAADAVASVKY